MPYQLKQGMTTQDFKTEIIEYYFPKLCSVENKNFADDYAAIGAFLTRTDDVLRNLKPLEIKLRALALEKANELIKQNKPNFPTGKTIYDTKEVTKKILTRVLQDVEFQEGFNKAANGLLHDNSAIGVGVDDNIDVSYKGRTTKGLRNGAEDVQLPGGVPKIVGSIHPTDFMVLLKHGYAFKDVGAESAHGEFTHRLQWYAIIQAKQTLGLNHTPIELYKKMWFSVTKGTENLKQNKALYMWMALLDNVNSEFEADRLNSMAWSPNTFNNPEYMNKQLTRKIYGPQGELNENDPSNLFVLGMILRARQQKRALGGYDGTEAYHLKKMVSTPGKKTVLAGAGGTKEGMHNVKDLKNVVVWLETL